MHVVALNTGFAPYEKLNKMMFSEARFWTYVLSYGEGSRRRFQEYDFVGMEKQARVDGLSLYGPDHRRDQEALFTAAAVRVLL